MLERTDLRRYLNHLDREALLFLIEQCLFEPKTKEIIYNCVEEWNKMYNPNAFKGGFKPKTKGITILNEDNEVEPYA